MPKNIPDHWYNGTEYNKTNKHKQRKGLITLIYETYVVVYLRWTDRGTIVGWYSPSPREQIKTLTG